MHRPQKMGDKVDKKRQRSQPPNQVWLDAIMSKTRSTDLPKQVTSVTMATAAGAAPHGSPMESFTSAMPPTPPPSMLHPPSTENQARSSAHRQPSPAEEAVFVGEQLWVDPSLLAAALSRALEDAVSEHDCSFIARGNCHLCGPNGHTLVPVVNFCPASLPSHSLCREHLRSQHRVRLRDIFAGKNQPTVSRRSLRCSVCSLSCRCPSCQTEREREVRRYRDWLADQPVGPSLSRTETTQPHSKRLHHDQLANRPEPAFHGRHGASTVNRMTSGGKKALPRSSGRTSLDHEWLRRESADAGDGGGCVGLEYMVDGRRPAPRAAGKQLHRDVLVASRSAHGARADGDGGLVHDPYFGVDEDDLPLSLIADRKTALSTRPSSRFPKRAAKESWHDPLEAASTETAPRKEPGHGDSASLRMQHGRHQDYQRYTSSSSGGTDGSGDTGILTSPSTTNSEESLVRLLSSLNQKVTPAVRAIAEPKDPAVRHERAGAIATYSAPIPRGGYQIQNNRESDRVNSGSRGTRYPRPETAMGTKDSRAGAGEQVGRRKSKGERESGPNDPNRSGTTGNASRHHSRQSVKRNVDLASQQQQDQLRKRKKENSSAPSRIHTHQPGNDKCVRKTAQHGVDSRRRDSAHADSAMANQQDEIEVEDNEDSELDMNLDYCEVCLAAGDLVCCDVCPRSFHLKCLNMREDELPEGEWQCAECKKPSYFDGYAAEVAKLTTVRAKCAKIIECLKSHPFAKPFILPVENVPHYSTVVKQPMDLSTIEKKLKQDKYLVDGRGTMRGVGENGAKVVHLGVFAQDVRLVWSNCKLFNDDGSGITRAADELSAGFERLNKDVLDFVARTAPNIGCSGQDGRNVTNTPMTTGSNKQAQSTSDKHTVVNISATPAGPVQANPSPDTTMGVSDSGSLQMPSDQSRAMAHPVSSSMQDVGSQRNSNAVRDNEPAAGEENDFYISSVESVRNVAKNHAATSSQRATPFLHESESMSWVSPTPGSASPSPVTSVAGSTSSSAMESDKTDGTSKNTVQNAEDAMKSATGRSAMVLSAAGR